MHGSSKFSQAVADEICAGLESGMTLRGVCAQDGMPSAPTVIHWIGEEDKREFAERYARARATGYQLMGDEILAIVDEPGDNADKRLRFDARRWMLSKMLPKLYGDKIETVHSGEVGIKRIERVIRKADDPSL